MRQLLCCLLALLLQACAMRPPAGPLAQALVPAPDPATRLVVVLPGRGDDLDGVRESGIVEAVQSAWPDADVVLADLSLAHYRAGGAPERLRAEVIEPARARGYASVWLAGASMGGMGVLLYDRVYPGDVDGLVLLAPYVGDRALLREIADAGGVAAWDAGPPQPMGAATWQRELWRHLQGWARDPARARNVWLAYGEDDRLRKAMPTLREVLRDDHVLVRPGAHAWKVWSPAAREILLQADAER